MFFVAVTFSDTKIAELFDLLRLLAQPDFARSAHVTLRGPYANKKDISGGILSKDVGKIQLRKAGNFFSERQHTVYLGVEIVGVDDFWYKPDFPNGTPHLSIYDGKDRKEAWVIFNLLRKFPWDLSLNSSPMHVLEAKRPVETEFIFAYEKIARTLYEITEQQLSAVEVRQLSLFERVGLMVKTCERIHLLCGA